MRNFFCHLSQMKSHTRQENVRAERQMRKQDNHNCTRAHNFKARTTNRGKGLTVTLARTLCSVPWSAPRPPHACHSHGVWAHPPSSRIQQTVEKLDTLWCPVPAPPLRPTPHERVASDTRQLKNHFKKKLTHSCQPTSASGPQCGHSPS